MSDIFREVEEDVRRERLEKIWKAYGGFAVVLAVLVLAGVAGFEVWQRHEAAQRAKTSDAYTAAQRQLDQLWSDKAAWNKAAVNNIAHVGWFSSDRTIREYAKDIWGIL